MASKSVTALPGVHAVPHPIIGVWHARIIGAPFEHHLLTFHADGTMAQANPHAGNRNSSDSIGMGPWEARGNEVHAKFAEVTASHETGAFMSFGEISLVLRVDGDQLHGTASASFYDEHNERVFGPTDEVVIGWRVQLNKPTPVS